MLEAGCVLGILVLDQLPQKAVLMFWCAIANLGVSDHLPRSTLAAVGIWQGAQTSEGHEGPVLGMQYRKTSCEIEEGVLLQQLVIDDPQPYARPFVVDFARQTTPVAC